MISVTEINSRLVSYTTSIAALSINAIGSGQNELPTSGPNFVQCIYLHLLYTGLPEVGVTDFTLLLTLTLADGAYLLVTAKETMFFQSSALLAIAQSCRANLLTIAITATFLGFVVNIF